MARRATGAADARGGKRLNSQQERDVAVPRGPGGSAAHNYPPTAGSPSNSMVSDATPGAGN